MNKSKSLTLREALNDLDYAYQLLYIIKKSLFSVKYLTFFYSTKRAWYIKFKIRQPFFLRSYHKYIGMASSATILSNEVRHNINPNLVTPDTLRAHKLFLCLIQKVNWEAQSLRQIINRICNLNIESYPYEDFKNDLKVHFEYENQVIILLREFQIYAETIIPELNQ